MQTFPQIRIFLILFLLPAWLHAADFVGSSNCQTCHQSQFKQWQQSHHAQAMLPASDQSVLGDFSGKLLTFHNIETLYFKKDGKYWVETLNKLGEKQRFEILYTFGFLPLQQYIVDIGKGHYQVLNVAWDSRPKEQGGQRWFHLQPDENITKDHPFFWAGHFQNWNSRCADCHSTNVRKNYNAENHSYNTEFSEVNVACEACHGPASEHLALARTGKLIGDNPSGFAKSPTEYSYLDMCGGCHSRRSVIGETAPLVDFHQSYMLQTLEEGLYKPDGQIQDEVFVMGSFLQSKMAGLGVTCANCHEPHSGNVIKEGDALCLQCHQADVYAITEHRPEGQCVDCHMPNTTYMQVDDRRDHKFHIPKEALSGWAEVNQKARIGDSSISSQLVQSVSDQQLPSIIRATLFNQLVKFPSPMSLQAVEKNLADPSPLVRRAAIMALTYIPLAEKQELLLRHLSDQNKAVRMEVVVAFLDSWPELSKEIKEKLQASLTEYREVLDKTADFPATQLAIAHMEMQLGNSVKAEKAYRQALIIEPAYVPALINYADFFRAVGQDAMALPLLKRALNIAPDGADVQHVLGLFWVRQKQYGKALTYLEQAVRQSDVTPRHVYVYAMALDSTGSTDKAIEVLISANQRWVNQYELMHLLIQLLHKQGRIAEAESYLKQLQELGS